MKLMIYEVFTKISLFYCFFIDSYFNYDNDIYFMFMGGKNIIK